MKFHWFAEVTYPWFEEPDGSSASPWVDLPRSRYDPAVGRRVYDRYLAAYEHAAAVGFDGLAVNEHHQYAGAVTPSPNLFAAILARSTERAAILTLGNSIALYQPPLRVAEEIAMLDVLSGGRMVAGFVVGTPMDAAHAYGVAPGELRDRFQEAHDLVLRAWEADESFAFAGRYTRLRHVNVWPRTVQRPRPPVWVPGFGSVETWELTARHDHCYAHLSFSGLERARAVVDGYWQEVARLGGDPNPHRFAFAQMICVAPTDAEAERRYAGPVEEFFRHVTPVPDRFADPPGYRTPRSVAAAARRAARETAPPPGPPTYRALVERGSVVAGSPATVRDRLRDLCVDLRVGQLVCILQMASLGLDETRENTELFAREVMPALRDLHAEHEDRWTPRPASGGRREQEVEHVV